MATLEDYKKIIARAAEIEAEERKKMASEGSPYAPESHKLTVPVNLDDNKKYQDLLEQLQSFPKEIRDKYRDEKQKKRE